MKLLLTPLLCLFLATSVHSQGILNDLVWAKKFASNGVYSLLVQTDEHNNIIVAGGYNSCPDCYIGWEGDSLFYQGNYTQDIFLAKLDSNGVLLWSKLIAGAGDDYLSGLRVDSHNNIILWIKSDQALSYFGPVLDAGHNLIKLDENGQYLWSQNMQGALYSGQSFLFSGLSKHVSLTCNDDIVIGGSVQKLLDYNTIVDTLIFGSDTLYQYQEYFDTLRVAGQHFAVDTNNIFVAKFSAQGDLSWVKTFEHNGFLSLASLDASVNEETNILGFYNDEEWKIDGKTLPIDTFGNTYKDNIFLMKLDPTGEIVWVNRYFDNVVPYNIITDREGNLISIGNFYGKTYFGQDTLVHTPVGYCSVFFKVDASGNYLWASNEGNPVSSNGHFILANHLGEIYYSGDITPHLGPILQKYSPQGHWLWTLNVGQNTNRDGGDITFDRSGNLIQTGLYSGTFKIGPFTLPYDQSGDWHQFILKFKSQNQPGPATFCDLMNGTSELDAGNTIEVYPNPSEGWIGIKLQQTENEPLYLELTDMAGKLLKQSHLAPGHSGEYRFDLQSFPPGAYVIRVQSGHVLQSRLVFLH